MKVRRSFWRPYPVEGPVASEVPTAWMQRMDSLLLSDPLELLDFVSDALISIVAKQGEATGEEYQAVLDKLLEGVREATLQPTYEKIITMLSAHWSDIATKLEEAGISKEMVYRQAREAPWPEDSVTSNGGNDD